MEVRGQVDFFSGFIDAFEFDGITSIEYDRIFRQEEGDDLPALPILRKKSVASRMKYFEHACSGLPLVSMTISLSVSCGG